MKNKLNLCKILEGREGIILYSTVYGYVKLITICDSFLKVSATEISNGFNFIINIEGDGRITEAYDGECTLFPDKDQRDWNLFIDSIPKNTPIMCAKHRSGPWHLCYYSHRDSDNKHYVCVTPPQYKSNFAPYPTDDIIILYKDFNPNDIINSMNHAINNQKFR